LRAFRARAADIIEIKISGFNNFAQPIGGLGAKLGLDWTAGVVGFGSVEADQADVGVLVVELDCVPVQN